MKTSLRSGWLNAEDFTDAGKAGSFIGQLRKDAFITIETVFINNIETIRVWYFK